MVEFAAEVSWTLVMAGLARDIQPPHDARVAEWLDVAGRTGMPVDTRLWGEGPIRSSYPACLAVTAAAQQASDGGLAYLRRVREGIMCLRRKLDTTEALVEEARGAGLDVERFRIDLASHATVEAFGADLERARGRALPTFVLLGEDGAERAVERPGSYTQLREAAVAAGAEPSGAPPPGVAAALSRFGRMAGVEVEAVCDLPEPRAQAELWRLAGELRVRPTRVLTGRLWEPA